LRPHADKFDKTLFQFCYIDGTDCVQGMSSCFRLLVASPQCSHSPVNEMLPTAAASSCRHRGDDENDFVEIEDEDGEIVIIKSRTAFLEDELIKLQSAAKVNLLSFFWTSLISDFAYYDTCYGTVQLSVSHVRTLCSSSRRHQHDFFWNRQLRVSHILLICG